MLGSGSPGKGHTSGSAFLLAVLKQNSQMAGIGTVCINSLLS